MAVPPIYSGAAEESARLSAASTCVEPDHRELIRSVAQVLHRRVRDNETAEAKVVMPLFCEDTHTEPEPEEQYEVCLPLYHQKMLSFPTLYTLRKLPPPKVPPPNYPIPSAHTVGTFIENIRHKARLTPQSLVITLIYVDRLEARSEGVLLHARSWRPVVFASLLLASKVWHDISYWNSDFSSICPMFTVRNINRMERAYLTLLQYNTIISASQYAQYYFSLRHTVRMPSRPAESATIAEEADSHAGGDEPPGDAPPGGTGGSERSGDNFRSKYFMAINVPSSARLQEQSAALAEHKKAAAAQAATLGLAAGPAAAPPQPSGIAQLREESMPPRMPGHSVGVPVPQSRDADLGYPPTFLATSI